MKISTVGVLYLPAQAVELAATLQAGDEDGWTYRAINPDGALGPFSKIEALDEDGAHVAYVSF